MLFTYKREALGWKPRQRGRAVIYLRGLDDSEADLINVPSIDTQRQICHREARDLGADVVEEFVDLAGSPLPRPGLELLLDRLDQQPAVNYLVVYSLDRLVPEREGAFLIGWHLGWSGAILVSWVHAYQSEIKRTLAD